MAISKLSNSTISNGLIKYQKFWDSLTYGSYVKTNLVLDLDAGNSNSYPGTGTTWFDLSGNSNHGSFVNSPVYGSGNGGFISFPGNAYVNCGNGSSLSLTNNFSISVVFSPNTWPIGSWATLVSKGDTSYRVQNSNGTLGFDFGTTGLSQVDTVSTGGMAKNGWFIVTSIFDGSSKKIYINGVLDTNASVTGTVSTNSFNVYIGENAQANSRFFNGKISAVQIYDKVLTLDEITQNYEYFKSRYIS